MFPWISLALAAPPSGAVAMDPVIALRFAWPDRMSCLVATTTDTSGLGGSRDGRVVMSRTLEVRDEGERLRIVHGPSRVAGADGTPMDAVVARRPDFLLSRDGHLRRVDGASGSPVWMALQERLAAEWERTFGMWSGLYVSETVSGSAVAEGASALFPEGAMAQWFYRFRVIDRVPCADEVGEPRCLALAYEANPWGTGMRGLLDAGARPVVGAPEGAGVTWTETLMALQGELVVESTTLVPYRRVEETRARARASWEGGGGALSAVVRTEEAWSCSVPAAPPPAPVLLLDSPDAPPPLPSAPPPLPR